MIFPNGFLDNKIRVGQFIIYKHKAIEVFARCFKKDAGVWWFEFLCVVKGSLVEDRSGDESEQRRYPEALCAPINGQGPIR